MKSKIEAALRRSNEQRRATQAAVASLFAESELPFNLQGELDDTALRQAALDELAGEIAKRARAAADQLNMEGLA